MTEGGLGDLGFSSESEGVDIAAQTSEASEADFKEYAKSLGVELEKDVDLVWVAREAFEAPLPASWSEHLDQERRIYFFNQVTQQSSWNHPMDEVFRDLLQLIKSVRRLDPPEASVVEAVQTHLQSCHDRASAALEGWSGPYAAEDGEYFYHAEQGVSTWHNPVEEWQTELSVRQQVLHRCLLHESPPNKAANGIARGRGASRDTSPPALPLHLARPMAEGATPPSPSSARSFATCISARSTSITPRSRRPSLCASEAPSRNNSKQRAEMPAQRPEKGPENSGKEGEGAGGEASETANRPRGLHPPERMVDEELEITFGSGGLTLPQFGQSEGTKE